MTTAREIVTRGDGTSVPTRTEVFVGKIPAPEDTTTMLWTARCSDASHDLLGHFGSRREAESAKDRHLKEAH